MPAPSSLQAIGSVQIGIPVSRPPMVLATTSTQQLFVTTGPVLLTGLLGIVTTVFDAAASLLKFWVVATGATDISAASASLTTATVGTLVYITGVFATATGIVVAAGPPISLATMGHGLMINQIIIPGGVPIGETTTTGQTTGQMAFTAFYVPLAPGAAINVV